ncbi:MAG TPA: sigma-70 family RNA polymerase sigma factor [Candidatus Nitrosotenuis sp.]|nr:sigma-70 family RNA polymerase sigma factor [Candidatus Nitrosotenuis sp.]
MDVLVTPFPDAAVSRDTSLDQEFEQRLRDSSALAFRVALGVLRNRDDAEDIAQEAFVRAYRGFSKLREREKFRGWIARIAFRLALDRIRSAKRRERREQAAPEPLPDPTVEDLAASSEFRARLRRAVNELPEKLRIVLVLAAIEGHDTREIAGLLELPEGTVKSRLFQARRILTEQLR